MDRVKHDLPEQLNGIAEADEMFILESQKGSRKLELFRLAIGPIHSQR